METCLLCGESLAADELAGVRRIGRCCRSPAAVGSGVCCVDCGGAVEGEGAGRCRSCAGRLLAELLADPG